MKFGSWTFEGKTLNYSFSRGNDRMDLSDYMKNGAWDIIDVPGHKSTIGDSITGEPKSIIVFKLVIRRKTLFYTVNLIIPCFLHALVCLCVFVLPAHGSEKITLVISVLVSLVVFLLLLQKVSCCDGYRKHKASYYVPYDDIVPVKFVFVLPINS
ncbi:acetylcholine receptor subunit beta-like 1 [Biomphalaria glabrata]|uniref:Neurotransmitter-gated ion-channel ligand-binding domain-containing protein n=1 Tax=Biomphalaria glabrata TaxID=6526 RepID=A0A2C9JL63_BIOGL